MSDFKGKNILIVGASGGIGAEIATRMQRLEAAVYTVSRSAIDSSDNHLQFDVVKDDPETLKGFLPERLDGFAYCPGSITLKPFHRLDREDFLGDLEINLLGAVRTIQAALPALKAAQTSGIVLFSTVAVRTGMNFHASIAAAKGAVEGLALSLAAEYAGSGLRVNVVAPSLTRTPLAGALLANEKKEEAARRRHPLKDIGTPAGPAGLAVQLLSEDSSWLSGQVIGVDGGLSALRPL